MHKDKPKGYYLPSPSSWPIKASIALICIMSGAANWLHDESFGPYLFGFGFLMMIYIMYGWFGTVIRENREGLLADKQVGRLVLWPSFKATWPLLQNPNPGAFVGPKSVMDTWGIPALNTMILLTSGVTITIAHWSLIKNKRKTMLVSQLATILLGLTFLYMQAHEYGEAYLHKGLTLASGIYGTTFFMLTGFHGLHVTIGTIGLIVIFYRMLIRDFNPHNHFAFEAVSWYWHFVDVVWLFLFIFVYWM
jgi:cytochrome c oxidase subunit 3